MAAGAAAGAAKAAANSKAAELGKKKAVELGKKVMENDQVKGAMAQAESAVTKAVTDQVAGQMGSIGKTGVGRSIAGSMVSQMKADAKSGKLGKAAK